MIKLILEVVECGTPERHVVCGGGKTPIASVYAYGKMQSKGPGDGSFTIYHLGPAPYERKGNSGPGGYWEAGLWGQGSVDGANTYAYCSGA